ncbi:MAG: hypothetical protein M1817_005077 [Caeruleum heppii]|nr:MAG: hypothetical protein M1817_005077 [Caeruleum heppii]
MVNTASLTAAAAAVLLALASAVDGLYSKTSPVLQITGKTYDRLIARSNYTSIVEFYAPWCGHCRSLQPAYEKAAKSLAGLAKVAAVDCDEESNKAFCGSMGVQGFPTLKIVKPGKTTGRPVVEDYQGPRNAKGIVDAVIDKIPNHVKRIGDKSLDGWLKEGNETAKAILFTDKGTTSALLRSLAIDFLGGISIAQIRDKEKTAVSTFGITKFPTLILLPGGDKDGIVYEGEMKKDAMTAFLSQITPPNPDPAPKKQKSSSSTPKKEATKKEATKKEATKKQETEEAKASFEDASSSHLSDEATEAAAGATSVVLGEESNPTESPGPIVDGEAPVPPNIPPPLPDLATKEALEQACLGPKTPTCILLLLPAIADGDTVLSEAATQATSSLAEISKKYAQRQSNLFPFYTIPAENPGAKTLRTALKLKGDGEVELVAVNGKRSWWTHFEGEEFGFESVEGWIDGIRLGEGKKERLPDGVVGEAKAEEEEAKPEATLEPHIEL